jgi:ribosomal protein S18 acetylase RimI-like enzyme
MSIRKLKLPDDMESLGNVAAEIFNYPEHPEWSVQADEAVSMMESMVNYKRIWPLIRIIQGISPSLRDILQGHVWEQDGELAGFTNITRQGTTDTWYFSGVGVQPAFRRRGIARALVTEGLDLIRGKNGRVALLDVIEGNLPAYKLYESLGFEAYTGTVELEHPAESAPAPVPLPAGYAQIEVSFYEWQNRYALNQRITPEHVQAYDPVEERLYRKPLMARLLVPLILKAQGTKAASFIIHTEPGGEVVAFARSETKIRQTGRHSIHARIDPEHAGIAPYFVGFLLNHVLSQKPGRIVEMYPPSWQTAVVEAARQAGFVERTRMHRMGLRLKPS